MCPAQDTGVTAMSFLPPGVFQKTLTKGSIWPKAEKFLVKVPSRIRINTTPPMPFRLSQAASWWAQELTAQDLQQVLKGLPVFWYIPGMTGRLHPFTHCPDCVEECVDIEGYPPAAAIWVCDLGCTRTSRW
mmetsp:Transcript_52826/g.115480  ORF Transcript_52826/g.115480 Transcript_52826/m.115480 type:complete len:131 (-) Transcript_52826:508-900(-)